MITLNNYVEYFANLSAKHPDLDHSEHSDGRVFEVASFDEAFGDFRTAAKEKKFFVRLLLPTIAFSRHQDNGLKHYQFGLMVGRWYSRREDGKMAQVEAFSAAEKVADDFIARMVLDSRGGHELFSGMADNIENLDLSGDYYAFDGDGSYAAILYVFTLAAFRQIVGACEETPWRDGGPCGC